MTQTSQNYINIRDLSLSDMMLPENDIKEGLSKAYVKAVANSSGYPINFAEQGADFGIDATITEVVERIGGRNYDNGLNLQIQIKSTTERNVRTTDNEIIYDLSNKNYNDLVQKEVYSPRILILLVLPDEKEEWLTHSIERLILKKCAYWTYLRGLPEKPNENSTSAVSISKSRTFCPDSLKAIMDKLSSRGDLNEL